MWLLIILGIIILIFGSFFRDREKMKKKVSREGGMTEKYAVVIGLLCTENGEIVRLVRDSVDIVHRSNGEVTMLTLTQAFHNVIVLWKSKSSFGEIKRKWEFPADMDQRSMAKKISKEIEKSYMQLMDIDVPLSQVVKDMDEMMTNQRAQQANLTLNEEERGMRVCQVYANEVSSSFEEFQHQMRFEYEDEERKRHRRRVEALIEEEKRFFNKYDCYMTEDQIQIAVDRFILDLDEEERPYW